jgi:hypothetical protein
MIGKPGPFQIIENDGDGNVDRPVIPPRRNYSCSHYDTCLNICASLNWDNFTCRGCSQRVDPNVLWRAQVERRNDPISQSLCKLPPVKPIAGNGEITAELNSPNPLAHQEVLQRAPQVAGSTANDDFLTSDIVESMDLYEKGNR